MTTIAKLLLGPLGLRAFSKKMGLILILIVPWKQNVDLTIVIVVMADAKKALSVTMYCHAEQPRILHSLNLADVAVREVSDYREFLVKKSSQNVTTKIAHDSEGIINPSEILHHKKANL